MKLKADADEIREFLANLGDELRLDASRRIWPRYGYRFDHVTAAASVLKNGRLYSREKCLELGLLKHDAANPGIISQTAHAHRFVRLYFGPRTPTQYQNEGIRPRAALTSEGAHCPVPVFMLFDLPELLSLRGVSFTNGNLARAECQIGDTAAFLADLPFEQIYHRGSISDSAQARRITFHRNAEILVEDELDLRLLRHVVCRTGPERDTLLTLLDDEADAWKPKIRLEKTNENYFERKGAFVSDVRYDGRKLAIRWKPVNGQFEVEVVVRDSATGETLYRRKVTSPGLGERIPITLPSETEIVTCLVRVDGNLVYKSQLTAQPLFG